MLGSLPESRIRRTSSLVPTGNRRSTKKVIGQLESVLKGLNGDEQCAEILRRLAAARGAINSLMGELMEDHIRNHMAKNSKSAEEAAEDMIQIVRTYLK